MSSFLKSEKAVRVSVLTSICVAYALSMVDRQLLAILQEPIKAELGLSDTQLGILGPSFAISYAVMSFPLAAAADRGRIRSVIVGCIVTWSIMTAFCGFAHGIIALAIGRIGVAIAEAGCTPASHSLISRHYAPNRRAQPLAILLVAGIVGSSMAFGAGGWIEGWLGWRWTFISLGMAGVALAPFIWVGIDRDPIVDRAKIATAPFFRPITRMCGRFWRVKTLRYMTLACGLTSLAQYGLSQWFASFLIRERSFAIAEAGAAMLAVGLPAGIFGALAGGWLCDRLARVNIRAYVSVPAVAISCGIPLAAAITSGPAILSLFAYAGIQCFGAIFISPVLALVQLSAPVDQRATAAALVILVINIGGLGCGPVVVGAISDMLLANGVANPLGKALLICALALAGAAILAFLAKRHVDADFPQDAPERG